MTHTKHVNLRSVVRRLRPSAGSVAAATAVVDPRPLLELKAAERERWVRAS